MRKGLNLIQWCPGCGDFIILGAIRKALQELGIPKQDVVIVSGVGCSGKISQYIDGYAAETLHGRAIPFALGVKFANPKLKVICIGGDGDGYGIGLGHFLHACRRNNPIIYLVLDNENYALTTGQASATTPLSIKTRTTLLGNKTPPFNPVELAKTAGCQFSRGTTDTNLTELKEVIKEAIMCEGFAHVNIKQACPSWKKW
ncbi:MAG: thiamine pyrophosphate-dependent enzyme [Candidatus Gracilibacteria bacterium]|jgi:2-oxoglutarate ferredoxin oxidoreductase subunit beta